LLAALAAAAAGAVAEAAVDAGDSVLAEPRAATTAATAATVATVASTARLAVLTTARTCYCFALSNHDRTHTYANTRRCSLSTQTKVYVHLPTLTQRKVHFSWKFLNPEFIYSVIPLL